MNQKSRPSLPGAPTLDEVTAIVERRHRNRQRLAIGTTTAFAAAGLTFAAIRADFGDPDPAELGPATSRPLPAPSVPSPTLDLGGCSTVERVDGIAELIDAGTDRYFRELPLTFEEALSLADEWSIPPEEIKTLAGIVLSAGVTLDSDVVSQSQIGWTNAEAAIDDLESVAAEWQLDPVSLKVISSVDLPEAGPFLEPCAPVSE